MQKLLLFVALLVVCSGLPSRVESLSEQQHDTLQQNVQFIIKKKPHYQWGASGSDLTKGLDCSGYVFRAAKWSGLPVRRTTALRMARGEAGWNFDEIFNPVDADDLDLVWWTMKPSRPHGHVGLFIYPKRLKSAYGALYERISNDLEITHASSSRNQVVVDKYSKFWRDKTSKIGRLQ